MIRLAATTSPVDLAWAAFDEAAIRFHRAYAIAPLFDAPEDRTRRQGEAVEVLRLWEEWRELFLGDEPGDVA